MTKNEELNELLGYFHVENQDTINDIEWCKTNLEMSDTGEAIYRCDLTLKQINRARRIIRGLSRPEPQVTQKRELTPEEKSVFANALRQSVTIKSPQVSDLPYNNCNGCKSETGTHTCPPQVSNAEALGAFQRLISKTKGDIFVGKKMTGAYYKPHKKIWESRAKVGGKMRYIGRYQTEKEAHRAYIKFLEKNGEINKYA